MPGLVSVTTEHKVLTVSGSISGNTAVVAAVPFQRIKVCGFECYTSYSGGALTPILTDGNGGTTIWERLVQAISGAVSGAVAHVPVPSWFCATSAGNALYLNPGGQAVIYSISYFTDDAS